MLDKQEANDIAKRTGFDLDFFVDGMSLLRLVKKIGNMTYVMYVENQPGPVRVVNMYVLEEGAFWQYLTPA